MVDESTTILTSCGRTVGPEQIRHAQEVVRLCDGLSCKELALTLCEHWGWVGVTGKPQERACYRLLMDLEKRGLLTLPARRGPGSKAGRACNRNSESAEATPGPEVEGALRSVQPVRLEPVVGRQKTAVFHELVERHHPLGYRRPFGCSLRYYIVSPLGRLGCLLMASGARALRRRDEWIGWSAPQRLANLPLVVNNSRFLVFPWVRVPHLASHVLGLLGRQVAEDWDAHLGYRPVLMETFVDAAKHRGTCYRAAGWQIVGETTGEGLRLRGHTYRTSRKLIFVRPLVRDFRVHLLRNPEPL